MNETEVKTAADFVLPPSVVNKLDVARLVSEAEQIDNDMTTAAVRAKTGVEENTTPILSQQLSDFMNQNELQFGGSHQRSELIKQLRHLKDSVPVVHMTFAVVADRDSLAELTTWLRNSVHPQTVIAVGLQPALVAGVYLRTPNRVHDFSLRAVFKERRGMLTKELETLRGNS